MTNNQCLNYPRKGLPAGSYIIDILNDNWIYPQQLFAYFTIYRITGAMGGWMGL